MKEPYGPVKTIVKLAVPLTCSLALAIVCVPFGIMLELLKAMKCHLLRLFILVVAWAAWGVVLHEFNVQYAIVPLWRAIAIIAATLSYLLATFLILKPITLKKDENTCDK